MELIWAFVLGAMGGYMGTSAGQVLRNSIIGGAGTVVGAAALRVAATHPAASAAIASVGAVYAYASSETARQAVNATVIGSAQAVADEVENPHGIVTAATIAAVGGILFVAGAPVAIPLTFGTIAWGLFGANQLVHWTEK